MTTPKPQSDDPRTQKWIDDNWNKLGTAEENPRAALGEPVTEYDGSTWVDYDKALHLLARLQDRVVELEKENRLLRQNIIAKLEQEEDE